MDANDQFYKDILDNLYDGVYLVDLDRRITYWNRGAERITGFSAQKVIGSCCADNILMHVNQDGVSLCRDRCPLKLIMENGESAEVEVYLHHADGHRVPVNVRAAPIYSAQGVTVSVGGACVQPDDRVESLLKRADTLLYKSKGKGRNQVSISGD